jgi:enoyl-CoA hydratase
MSWSLERRGGVATCTHANPPRHTLSAAGVQGLHEKLDALERDPSLRVLVLTGGGDGVFVAHYEVGELAAAAQASSGGAPQAPAAEPARLHPFHALCLRLERLPAITLAALNGNAAGGGCELALACDFRLIADGPFHFGLPETSVGIIPGAGGTQRMARLLGTARALDLILHARLLAPREALELGLVHRVLPAADFREETERFAKGLAGRAPIALAAAKRAIRAGVELPLAEGLALEQQEFERCMRSQDAAGALRAWLAGERWDWKGE